MKQPELRRLALELYRTALEAVRGDRAVVRALPSGPLGTPVALVAIGKAACAMAAGARQALGDRVGAGLVITRHGYETGFDVGDLPVLTAGHPVPDAASLRAGRRLLDFLEAQPPDREFLFLVSGGASSLVEVPRRGVTLEDLARANDWLLASGLDIHQVNRVRASLSDIKAGRLAARLGGRPARVLLISDVPGDLPASIGSGLLSPPAEDPGLPACLPPWLAELAAAASPAPRPDEPSLRGVSTQVIAGNRLALQAAATRARELGLTAIVHAEPLAGPTGEAAGRIAAALLGPGAPGDPLVTVHLWGGETTPALPVSPGRGGRCQHLALALAPEIAGRLDVGILCAGTDGSDGPGDDAGALVDGDTLERGRREGMDAARCLAAADAGRFLEAAGDLISTGPTGTNVMDLVIAVVARGADFPLRRPASTLAPGTGGAL